jgi:hypothetical protein
VSRTRFFFYLITYFVLFRIVIQAFLFFNRVLSPSHEPINFVQETDHIFKLLLEWAHRRGVSFSPKQCQTSLPNVGIHLAPSPLWFPSDHFPRGRARFFPRFASTFLFKFSLRLSTPIHLKPKLQFSGPSKSETRRNHFFPQASIFIY